MYYNNYVNPKSNIRYTNYPSQSTYSNDERFFLAPFLVGGLAGTALGYGIANNNNQMNKGCCPVPIYYVPPYQTMYPQNQAMYPQNQTMFPPTYNTNFYN